MARESSRAAPDRPTGRVTAGHDARRLVVGPSLLHLGARALEQALRLEAPADMVLRQFFRAHPKLGRRDRGIIAESVFAVLRQLSGLTLLAGGRSSRRLFQLGVHRHAEAAKLAFEVATSGEEQAWLARALATGLGDAPLAIRAELPGWIVEALRATMNESEILALGEAMQHPAPLDLRVNTLKATRDETIRRLADSGIPSSPLALVPTAVRVQGKPALERHELFLGGAVEVQDAGSQLLSHILAPKRREMVVDFCAGAGGKTLHIGAMMRSEGRIYAFDISPQRLNRLRDRAARAGLSNIQSEAIAGEADARFKRLAGKIDRVLVDAPCTGTGTLRRNPDLKWRQQPSDLGELAAKQSRILAAAARLVKPGGRLVYATCSILPAENDVIVDAFLEQHPHFRPLDCGSILAAQGIELDCGERLRLSAHRHGTDAFFAAAFERAAAPPSAQADPAD